MCLYKVHYSSTQARSFSAEALLCWDVHIPEQWSEWLINNLLMVWNICPWCPLSFSIAATNTEDYEQSHRFRSCPCCGTCWAQLFCTEHMLCTQDACSMYPHMLEQIALYMLTRLLLTWHTLDFQMVLDSWITMTSKCSWIAKCFFSSKIKVPASHSKVATSADIVHSNFHS